MIRHGESEANVAKTFGGPSIELSAKGRKEALDLSEKIDFLKDKKVYVSPYVRARQTMEILGLQGDIIEDLREVGLGILQDRTFEDLESTNPIEAKKWAEDSIYYALPGGESIEEAQIRIGRVLEDLIEKDEDVVLVCHDGVIRNAITYFLGDVDLFNRFALDNLSLTCLSYQEDYKFIKYVNRIL